MEGDILIKNRTKRLIKDYIKIICLLFIFGSLLKICAYCIPNRLVIDNFVTSVSQMKAQGEYPVIVTDEFYYELNRFDNYSDMIILNEAITQESFPILEAVYGDYVSVLSEDETHSATDNLVGIVDGEIQSYWSYARQWSASVAIIRILLVFWNYNQIRVLSHSIMIILLLYVVARLYQEVDMKTAMSYGVAMVLTGADVSAYSTNLCMAFYIMNIGALLALKMNKDDDRHKVCLLVAGLTALFDMFSVPFVTVGIVVLMRCIDYKNNNRVIKKNIIRLMFDSIMWLMGYLGVWITKWLAASIILRKNFFLEAFNESMYQSQQYEVEWGPSTFIGYIGTAIKYTLYNVIPINLIKTSNKQGFILGVVLILMLSLLSFCIIKMNKNKEYRMRIISVLPCNLLMVLFPCLCCIVMRTHAYVHYWMWIRIWFVSIFAGLYIIFDVIMKQKEQENT